MNVTESKVKIKIGNKLYTFMQKDEENEIKFYLDTGDINLVTKDEALDNIENSKYVDNIRAFYYCNGSLIQLALKENIDVPKTYELIFNKQEGFEVTDNLERDKYFTTAKVLNISRSFHMIEYNKYNDDIITDNENRLDRNDSNISLAESTIAYVRDEIDLTSETNINYNNLEGLIPIVGCRLLGISATPSKNILDFTNKETYENQQTSELVEYDALKGLVFKGEVIES